MADGAPQAAVKKRMLRIASGCATREAFISVFRRFCDRDSIFIATRTPKEAGAGLQFSITLADGAPLIGGTGTVLESWSDQASPYGRAGMRIRFDDLTPSGQALIDELVEARKAEEETRPGGVPVSAAAAALAALAKAGPPPTTPPRPVTPPIKPLPSVIPKAGDHRQTMLGMTPLKRPAKLEATPAPVAMPRVAARDVEVKLPPPPRPPARPTPDGDVTDEQTTGVAAKFTPDTAFPDEASWDEAANHVLGSTRAKGSDLVLPANPLGTVERESIDAFVECTIYEETGTFAVDDGTAPGPAHPDDWREDDLTIPPWLQGPVADSPFAADSMAVPPPLLPLDSHSSRPIEPPARPPTPPPDRRTSSELRARLVDAGKAFDPAKVPAARPILKGDRRSHWPLTIAIAAAAGLAGMAIGYFAVRAGSSGDGGGDQPAASESPAEVASAGKPSQAPAPAEAAEPAPEQPAKPAAVEPPAASDVIAQPEPPAAAGQETGPPPAAEETSAAADDEPAIEFSPLTGKLKKDRCGAEIDSRPDKADVFIGATRIGQTPLKVVLPCGEHAMELRRARYQRLEKRIDLDQGKLDKVEVVMARPEHRLRISSVPGGAAVTVNGRAAGTTPATVTVNGFEQARISVALSGYKSWSTRVYVRDPTTSVSARLAADKASTGKPAARPGKTSGSRAAESPARRGN